MHRQFDAVDPVDLEKQPGKDSKNSQINQDDGWSHLVQWLAVTFQCYGTDTAPIDDFRSWRLATLFDLGDSWSLIGGVNSSAHYYYRRTVRTSASRSSLQPSGISRPVPYTVVWLQPNLERIRTRRTR